MPKRRPAQPPQIDPDLARAVMRSLASKGGKAGTGKAKARDPEVMRAAALKRWEEARAKRPEA